LVIFCSLQTLIRESLTDLKEALNFREDPTEPEQNCPPGFDLSYYPGNGTVKCNQWPEKPAKFRSVMYEYHAAVMEFSRQLLHMIALALDLEEDYFDNLTRFPMAGLRPLYYPAQDVVEDMGLAAHADYSWFTVVNQLTGTPALEVLNANGHWVGAPPIKNTLVVNVGDFLERATNEVFVSTVHRVINHTPGEERYSIPLFFSPSHNAMIDIVPTCWSETRPKKFEPVLAGKWQRERLYRSRFKHPVAIAAKARGEA
jgi:isopenicillin N synthase-like dioxygenase